MRCSRERCRLPRGDEPSHQHYALGVSGAEPGLQSKQSVELPQQVVAQFEDLFISGEWHELISPYLLSGNDRGIFLFSGSLQLYAPLPWRTRHAVCQGAMINRAKVERFSTRSFHSASPNRMVPARYKRAARLVRGQLLNASASRFARYNADIHEVIPGLPFDGDGRRLGVSGF